MPSTRLALSIDGTNSLTQPFSPPQSTLPGTTNVLVTAQLTALGLDSLGFVELGGRLKKAFNIEMDSVKMSPDMTLEDVAKMIYKLQVRVVQSVSLI